MKLELTGFEWLDLEQIESDPEGFLRDRGLAAVPHIAKMLAGAIGLIRQPRDRIPLADVDGPFLGGRELKVEDLYLMAEAISVADKIFHEYIKAIKATGEKDHVAHQMALQYYLQFMTNTKFKVDMYDGIGLQILKKMDMAYSLFAEGNIDHALYYYAGARSLYDECSQWSLSDGQSALRSAFSIGINKANVDRSTAAVLAKQKKSNHNYDLIIPLVIKIIEAKPSVAIGSITATVESTWADTKNKLATENIKGFHARTISRRKYRELIKQIASNHIEIFPAGFGFNN